MNTQKNNKNGHGINIPAKKLPMLPKRKKDWRHSFHWRVFRIMAEFVDGFQFLAVKPGLSGQALDGNTMERIRTMRAKFPDMIIEVDGGVVPETAKQMREAGATQVVSGSYIFNNPDPMKAFSELMNS